MIGAVAINPGAGTMRVYERFAAVGDVRIRKVAVFTNGTSAKRTFTARYVKSGVERFFGMWADFQEWEEEMFRAIQLERKNYSNRQFTDFLDE